jgi:putative ABC transport system substrate-binding protein
MTMKRRDFITLLGGAAAWPMAARAQQRSMPVIGILSRISSAAAEANLVGFRKGLSETGFFEGQNVAIEYRWGNLGAERLPELAADLVRRRVSVFYTIGETAADAVKTLTTTIPVVFLTVTDPVESGLVASLNRPGGNVTGVNAMSYELAPKQLGVLHDLLPRARRIGFITEALRQAGETQIANLQAAGDKIACTIDVLRATNSREIDAAFDTLLENKTEALIVNSTILFTTRRAQILTLAARHAVPTIYAFRDPVLAGGLMSYGPNNTDQARQCGIYTGRILRGEKPSDLPVLQPTKFELVLNQQTAKILGIEIPPTLLAIADEVIE